MQRVGQVRFANKKRRQEAPKSGFFCHNNHVTRLLLIFALLTPALAHAAPQNPVQDGSTVTLSSLLGVNPALLLFDSDAGSTNFRKQWDILTANVDVLNARNFVVIPILSITAVALPPSNGLTVAYLSDVDMTNARAKFHCNGTGFCAVFMARDGNTQQVTSPFNPTALLALVHPAPSPMDQFVIQQQNIGYQNLTAPSAPGTLVLTDLLGSTRPLLIFSMHAADRSFITQWNALAAHASELTSRNVIVLPILSIKGPALPPAHGLAVKFLDDVHSAKARHDFSCPSAYFCVVLLGKDGVEKLHSESPVTLQQITSTIDGTPRRQEEMQQQQQAPSPAR